jgi:hypothetical protein
VISEPQTSIAELFVKDTVLFAQVFDHLKWRSFIHPARAIRRNRNGSRGVGMYSPYYRQARPPDQPGQQRRFNKIQFSGHTTSAIRRAKNIWFLNASSSSSNPFACVIGSGCTWQLSKNAEHRDCAGRSGRADAVDFSERRELRRMIQIDHQSGI